MIPPTFAGAIQRTKKPGSGEFNYANVYSHIANKRRETLREFVFGMEHGNSSRGADSEEVVTRDDRGVDPRRKSG